MQRLPLAAQLQIRQFEDLAPLLKGEVFHVTTADAAAAIEVAGYVEPNTYGTSSPFGNTTNGYFRTRGCVSLFDYREYGSAEWNEHAHKCLPTLPLLTVNSIVILLLQGQEYAKLVPWSRWKEEEAWSQRVVPYIEVGYPGRLPVSALKKSLVVSLAPA